MLETTALGAAWLAGMRAGIYPNQQEFSETWSLERRFEPQMHEELRMTKYAAWQKAVQATLNA